MDPNMPDEDVRNIFMQLDMGKKQLEQLNKQADFPELEPREFYERF